MAECFVTFHQITVCESFYLATSKFLTYFASKNSDKNPISKHYKPFMEHVQVFCLSFIVFKEAWSSTKTNHPLSVWSLLSNLCHTGHVGEGREGFLVWGHYCSIIHDEYIVLLLYYTSLYHVTILKLLQIVINMYLYSSWYMLHIVIIFCHFSH